MAERSWLTRGGRESSLRRGGATPSLVHKHPLKSGKSSYEVISAVHIHLASFEISTTLVFESME
jgi:hypothetical protein